MCEGLRRDAGVGPCADVSARRIGSNVQDEIAINSFMLSQAEPACTPLAGWSVRHSSNRLVVRPLNPLTPITVIARSHSDSDSDNGFFFFRHVEQVLKRFSRRAMAGTIAHDK